MFKDLLKKFILWVENTKKKRAEKKSAEPAPEGEKKKMPKGLRIALRGLWAVFLTGMLTCIFTVCVFAWYVFVYVDGEYDLSYLDNSLGYTTILYGNKDGETVEIEQLHGTENRKWVDIDDISKHMQNAVVAIEDERFYKHDGVDLKRTGAAVLNFARGDGSFGGSTITQQLIKNLTEDDDHTITRKIQEMRRAWYVESQYNKSQILEVYLNTIYLSQGCYGVQTASEKYFGKNAADLSIAEAACIASITNLPSYYDPKINPENNKKRANLVISKMQELGYITKEEAEAAKAEELVFRDGTVEIDKESIKSYYVDAVTEAVIDDLIEKKGYSEVYAETLVYSSGLQIYTAMDVDVQNAVDSVYSDPANFPNIYAKNDKGEVIKPESAISIIDNSTGACVALYGGIGEKTTARGTNRATMAYRQPGSSIKPLSTYAPGIEYGVSVDGSAALSPYTMILDWYLKEDEMYPRNQSRVESNKKVSLTHAVAYSLNTVAARVNTAVGYQRSYDFLVNNLGFTSLNPVNDVNVAALGLGALTKGVTVYEMSAAYASFPNDGVYTKPYLYTRVVDQNGRVLLENKVETKTAMNKETARVMNQLLSFAASSGTGTPANFGTTEIAGKTGTTSFDYDRWFAGYTDYYSAVVWYGYDYNETVVYGGANPAATTWKKVMKKVHEGLPYKNLTKPTTLVSASYCMDSGMALTEFCPTPTSGYFLPAGVPTTPCTEHTAETMVIDPATGKPVPKPEGGETTDTPATDKPTTDKPTTDKPTTDKPTTDKPATDKPTTDKPTTNKPTTDTPTTDKPTTDKPTTDKPATDKPTTDTPPAGGSADKEPEKEQSPSIDTTNPW